MPREVVRATAWGVLATAIVAAAIVVGSRNLSHFDAALVGYTFATLFATFGLTYRYSMWLQRPPTGVFRRPGDGSAVVAAARGPGGAEVLWTHTAAADDGDLTLLGVYRTGAGAEAWITIGDARSPRALLVASSPDGRAWTAAGPVPLRDP